MAKATKQPISVVARRLKSGSIFSAGSKPIPLAEPARWNVRVVNTTISDDRLWQMQADKGWVYLDVADLAVAPHEIGFRELDGRVVRGQQGQEVLMKMPRQDYKAVQAMKEAENKRTTFSPKSNKQAIVGAASSELGDQAASFLNRAVQSVDIKDSRETVNLED